MFTVGSGEVGVVQCMEAIMVVPLKWHSGGKNGLHGPEKGGEWFK